MDTYVSSLDILSTNAGTYFIQVDLLVYIRTGMFVHITVAYGKVLYSFINSIIKTYISTALKSSLLTYSIIVIVLY
jgi:hypothetical protein